MSIEKVEMCIIKCDRCGEVYQRYDGICAFVDNNTAEEEINNQPDRDWEKVEGKHYCPDCYVIDEETERIIIK